LAKHPDWAPQLATWTYNAWHSYNPDLSEADELSKIKTRMNTDRIPLTLVLVASGSPVGMANLKLTADVPGLPQDKVWVGSFYVEPQYAGGATKLLQAICQQAIKLNVKELWVWESSPNAPAFYLEHGWKLLNVLPFKGHTITLLKWQAP
jgi:GNAT superfamily N-acetyltransferase